MTGKRQLVSSGGPFERKYGYSRAVRVGSRVFVAGTAAFKDGVPFAPGDAGAQTRHILDVIERALEEAGASLADVTRYRVYVTNMDDHPAVAGEMGRVFGEIRPAGTLVGTSELIHPDLRVEIEVDAIIGSGDGGDAMVEAVSIDQLSS